MSQSGEEPEEKKKKKKSPFLFSPIYVMTSLYVPHRDIYIKKKEGKFMKIVKIKAVDSLVIIWGI
jgi:hypothetical protein